MLHRTIAAELTGASARMAVDSNNDSLESRKEEVFGAGGKFYMLFSGIFLSGFFYIAAIFVGQYIVIRSRQIVQRHLTESIFASKVQQPSDLCSLLMGVVVSDALSIDCG